jgi:dipeptidyl aminopeptidase/acylaminoacyl peptidase
MKHIARKGYVVVWVQYQNGVLTPPWLFARYAVVTWKDALNRLDAEDSHVRPQKNIGDEYKTAVVGHSAGGYLSAIVAAKAAKQRTGIPSRFRIVSFL